jgi:hypothetical protein
MASWRGTRKIAASSFGRLGLDRTESYPRNWGELDGLFLANLWSVGLFAKMGVDSVWRTIRASLLPFADLAYDEFYDCR